MKDLFPSANTADHRAARQVVALPGCRCAALEGRRKRLARGTNASLKKLVPEAGGEKLIKARAATGPAFGRGETHYIFGYRTRSRFQIAPD
jgi:hypothetical protein